jgi:hypothetical protein
MLDGEASLRTHLSNAHRGSGAVPERTRLAPDFSRPNGTRLQVTTHRLSRLSETPHGLPALIMRTCTIPERAAAAATSQLSGVVASPGGGRIPRRAGTT